MLNKWIIAKTLIKKYKWGGNSCLNGIDIFKKIVNNVRKLKFKQLNRCIIKKSKIYFYLD